MKRLLIGSLTCTAFFASGIYAAPLACGQEVIKLWPGEPAGPAAEVRGEETDTSNASSNKVAGKSVQRLTNVADPEIHIYRPEVADPSGAACVICPGGGFNILAWDLEGTEVAQWFNSQGITAVVLKYRVPTSSHGEDKRFIGPVNDTHRAIRYTRTHAEEWNIDPERIGLLGFSAGGLTAAAAAISAGQTQYEAVDEVDQTSAAANFAMLIYPAWMADDEGRLQSRFTVDEKAPPTFFVHAFDDPVSCLTSTALFAALKQKGVPSELHIYSSGGHGYGLRKVDAPVATWPAAAEAWLKSQGLVSKK